MLEKRVVVIAAQIAFHLIGAIETLTSKRSALSQNLADALTGNVREMYPGFAARSSYAIAMAMKSFPRVFSHLRLLRWWWRMRKDLASIDTKGLAAYVFTAWYAAQLRGFLPIFFDKDDPSAMAVATDRSPMQSAIDELPDGWRGKEIGFNDYISAHREINHALEVAKIWWTFRERERTFQLRS